MKRAVRVLLVLFVGLCVGLLLLWLNIGRVVLWSMHPSKRFSESPRPRAPDYNSASHWSALPTTEDLADLVGQGLTAIDQRQARVDVFYLHPTSFLGGEWNAPVPSPALDGATDRGATRIQASAFNGCCAVYAPRYRQTNGLNFLERSEDGERAFALAYDDVERAFDAFNARRGEGRPFIIAAHSQGSMLAERLLERRVSRTPLRERLVAAYLIGARATTDGLRAKMPDIPLCDGPRALRCIVAYNARSEGYVMGAWDTRVIDPGERACVNPLTWRLDGARAPASANLGAVFLDSADTRTRPGFADAQCQGGVLRVRTIGVAPRDFMSSLLDRVLGAGNYHPIEYQMFYRNLRANAIERCEAMLSAQ
ncbi:MAG: DUF3089 domain-containing protein [Polyangiales bacterium]